MRQLLPNMQKLMLEKLRRRQGMLVQVCCHQNLCILWKSTIMFALCTLILQSTAYGTSRSEHRQLNHECVCLRRSFLEQQAREKRTYHSDEIGLLACAKDEYERPVCELGEYNDGHRRL